MRCFYRYRFHLLLTRSSCRYSPIPLDAGSSQWYLTLRVDQSPLCVPCLPLTGPVSIEAMGSTQSAPSPPRHSRRISLPPPPKSSSSPELESKGGELIRFPDLVKSIPFPLRLNPYTRFASAESDAFIIEYGKFSEKQLNKFVGLNAGLLCGMCYAECEPEQLRVCTDFMSFLFNLDDWSDEFDTAGTKGLEEAVMNTLWHPDTYHSDSVAARTAKSCVCQFYFSRPVL